MENIFIQELKNYDIESELKNIGFDKNYLNNAKSKYEFKTIKIYNLKAIEANILKQTALSVGSDCAVHKNVILNADGNFACIICATVSNLEKIAQKLKLQQFNLKKVARQIENTIFQTKKQLMIKNIDFDFNNNKYVMGILNITPDSFSDGGLYFDKKSVMQQYLKLVRDGADIIDIGAQSTRPDYIEIDDNEEIKRLNLLFESDEYKNNRNIVTSIDTYKYKVAEHAIKNNTDIINDITGFCNKNMINLAVDSQKPVIVMFNQKNLPASGKNTFQQMYEFFISKIDELTNAGVKFENIIIDCGFGFLKNNDENVLMLKNLANLKNLKCPVLLSISRKSFLKKISCNSDADELSLYMSAKYIDDVDILRVHDVKKYKDLINL